MPLIYYKEQFLWKYATKHSVFTFYCPKHSKNMRKTLFHVREMDCPCEEHLIRLKLNDIPSVKQLDFDIVNRKLIVYHEGELLIIEQAMCELNLGAEKISSENANEQSLQVEDTSFQRKMLIAVLLINAAFFAIEMLAGLFSRSMSLVADSLDMLADAFVYAISLFAVGKAVQTKKNTAKIAGYFQILLAVIGFAEVLRRFILGEALPDFRMMIIVSMLALAANAACLYLLQKTRSNEVHMQASMIFTSNDIIINLGVIIGGVLVYALQSELPDLIIGSVVFIIVLRGAIRILQLAR